jgi:hypothetical protein
MIGSIEDRIRYRGVRAAVIKYQGARRQLRVRKERTSGRIFRKTVNLGDRKANSRVFDWATGSE